MDRLREFDIVLLSTEPLPESNTPSKSMNQVVDAEYLNDMASGKKKG